MGLFNLGHVAATHLAVAALEAAHHSPLNFLMRHESGDWGDMDAEDCRANDAALKQGERIMSAYSTRKGVKFWLITEADRSVTTFLLPEEY